MLKAIRRAVDRHRHGQGAYAHLFERYQGDEVVALDCETTGLDPRNAELVSIAAVPVREERALSGSALDIRLRHPAGLSGDSIRIHRLRPMDLSDGLSVEDALAALLDFIGNRPLLGWCIDFDVAVINRHLRPRFGFELPNATIEVSALYQRYLRRIQPEVTPDLRFEAIAKALSLPELERHSAKGDATTTALMYLRLKKLGAVATPN